MLFDDRDSERERDEVSIRPTDDSSGGKKGQLENEVRARSSSSESGIAIPDASSSSDSKSVSLEDIHEQNKKIIGLLQDLKDQGSGSSDPGSMSPDRSAEGSSDKGDVSELL